MRSAMKVLHVIDRLDKRLGGAVQATLGICKYLALAGETVEAAGSIAIGDQLDHLDLEFSNFKTYRFERSFPKRYAHSRDFNRWFSEAVSEYDIVEVHAIFSAFTLQTAKICRQHGIRYVVRPHGSLDPFDLQKHAALKKIVGPALIRPLLEGASAVLLTTDLEADRLVTYGARASKRVLPLPIPLPKTQGDRQGFRLRHGIPQNAQVVLFLSRIDYKKGLNLLIPALRLLKSEFPNLWFLLAGSGDAEYSAQVDRWLDGHGVMAFTTKAGFVSGIHKQDAFAAADLFALPSMNENFGIVNIEAMNAGLPVLVSQEVYVASDIEKAGAGITCSTTVDSVAECLRRLLGQPSRREQMGRQGRLLVATKYQPENVTRSLVAIYREILGQSA